MSTKTNFKRVALVAVVALGAGVLSVAPANAGTTHPLAGVANMAAETLVLSTATAASTTGSASSAATTDGSTNRSTGLLYKDTSTGTAQSATVLSTGALVVYTLGDTDVAFVASGGAFSGLTATATATTAVSADRKTASVLDVTDAGNAAPSVTWSSSTAGTYQISLYRGNAIDGNSTATDGTLVGILNVTVTATSTAAAYSAADSACILPESHAADSTTSLETAGANYQTNGDSAFVTFDLRDAYGVALAAGATVATATNGAWVNIVAGATKGIGSTAVSAAAPTDLSVVVSQPVANAPVSTTVTVTYNGTVVCTKSIIITGEVASMKASSVLAGKIGGAASAAAFKLRTYDAAGNLVIPVAARFAAVPASLSAIVTAASITTAASALTGDTADSYSTGTFTCGSTAGTKAINLAYQNVSGTIAASPAISARCAGAADTYTASFDKASYVQGEIATLTVQFKDNLGNAANSYDILGAASAVVTSPMLTMVGTPPAGATNLADVNGQTIFKFTVGGNTAVTAGAYNALVDYPTLTAVNAKIQTVAYKVSTGDSGVTNAEVLKSIVALIASINKQIQALQKLILKR
jgi:hypothetical protein